ncbi:MAG: hypothetical protein IKK87_10900 [Bacteroidaceae bacterium]|nr:hypothetical protein [Bacteroidaceae bacterium]
MNKKVYITPSMEEMNIETVEMMAMSNGDDSVMISDDITEDDAKMGRGHRGTWGDLWSGRE